MQETKLSKYGQRLLDDWQPDEKTSLDDFF